MSISTLNSLTYSKQYVNIPFALVSSLRKSLGPSLYSIWETLYTESIAYDGVISRSYDYLSERMGCSRSTVIRQIKRLCAAGLLILEKRYAYKCSLANVFRVIIPENLINIVKFSSDRKSRSLDIDYSVNHDIEEHHSPMDGNNRRDICKNRALPVSGDTRGLLNQSVGNRVGGSVGKMLDRIKHNLSPSTKVSNCNPSILDLNQDNNKNQLSGNSGQPLIYPPVITEPKTAITGYSQKESVEKEKIGENERLIRAYKSVSKPAINKIKCIVSKENGVSDPLGLVQEAIYFVANRKEGVEEWRAVGAFKKLLKHGWSTPFGMRKSHD